MVNAYSSYPNYNQAYYNQMPNQQQEFLPAYEQTEYRKPSSAPAAFGGLVLGSAGGALLAKRKNKNISKNGEVTDTFAKRAYEQYMKKSSKSAKTAYAQGIEILGRIGKIKSVEDLRALFNNNAVAAEQICNELNCTADEFVSGVTQDNLGANKKAIQERIKAGNNTRYQDMKNRIQACWNREKKKFERPEGMEKDMFKAIKKAANNGGGKMLKYAAAGGVITGCAAYILHKLFANKNA